MLSRPREGRVLGGGCVGVLERFGCKRSTVRVAFVLSCILPGPPVALYLLLLVVIPSSPWQRAYQATVSARPLSISRSGR